MQQETNRSGSHYTEMLDHHSRATQRYSDVLRDYVRRLEDEVRNLRVQVDEMTNLLQDLRHRGSHETATPDTQTNMAMSQVWQNG